MVYHPLSGTNTTRDHVELPSQLNEHWLETPELLQKFACHVTDGSALPMDLVKKIEAASTFAQGFGTVEFLASALVDLRMHTAPAGRCPLSSPPTAYLQHWRHCMAPAALSDSMPATLSNTIFARLQISVV